MKAEIQLQSAHSEVADNRKTVRGEKMNRQGALIMIVGIVGAALIAGTTAFAQRIPYTQVMKDVGATFASLRKNLDGNSGPAAAQDAMKLEASFKEAEAFWAQFNTKDAVDLAREAEHAFADVGAKAKGNDIKGAQTTLATIGRICGDCHFSHREDTGKGFVIKP